jgi:[acyl-carrier-protein] S-malonyltransferase
MKEASEKFKGELENKVKDNMSEIFKNYKDRGVTLFSNMTASGYTEDIVSQLSRQICSPVQWEKIVRNMIADGVDTFVEIGPGKTLTNMIKKIDGNVKAGNYTEYL